MADDPDSEVPAIDDAEYRRTLEAALDALETGVVITRDGRIFYASAAYLRIMGYTLQQLRSIDALSLVDESQRAELLARMSERRRGRGGQTSYDVRVRHGSGRIVELHIANSPLPGPGVNLLSIVRDVTEERAMSRRGEQAHRMESIGHLCTGIVHDFSNYLTAVRMIAESMAAPSADHRGLLAELEEVTVGASRLTQQLQTFTGTEVKPDTVLDVNIVVFEMSAMLRRLIGRHVEFALNLEPGLPPTRIHAGQLQQVIVNLVVNASEAVGDHGGRVTLQTCAVGDEVLLTVSDDGCGMSEETLGRVFEPLFSTHPESGSGMGLAIVYGIVRQCGGLVEMESKPGEGTVVRVHLPVARASTERRRSSDATAALAAQPLAVLIVEQMTKLGALMAAGLGREGFVVERTTVDHASELLSSTRFDALIIDVEPSANVAETWRQFRVANPGGTTVFVSTPPTLNDSDWEGGTRVLAKPFSIAELVTAIRSVT